MATQYIHFTEEQKQTARQTDIAELLRRQGQTLKRSGSEYEWKDGSAKVTVRGNLWFHQYDHEGGDAIDFVRRFMGKSYPEAVEFLLSGCGGSLTLSPPIQRQPPKPFVLPEKNEDMRRVYAYLLRCRGLNRDVVNVFAQKNMIYESAPYHNAIFVGYDKTECLAMRINAAAVPRALTRAIRTAACRSMPFTGMGKVTASIYLKRPSTC